MMSIIKPQPERMRLKGDFKGLINLINKTKEPEIRREAILALGRMQTPSALPVLISLLSDPDLGNRRSASHALIRFGKDAVPDLTLALSDAPEETAEMIHHTLIGFGDEAAEIILKNVPGLNGIGYERAAYVLYSMGTRIIPYLIRSFSIPERKTCEFAESIIQVFGRSSLNALIKALNSEDEEIKARSAALLILLGEQIVPDLLISSIQDDEALKDLKLLIISEMGYQALPPLSNALSDSNPVLSSMARRVFLDLGSSGMKYLISGIYSNVTGTAAFYEKCLLNIGPGVMPFLFQEVLVRPDNQREPIISLMINLGEPVIPILVHALNSEQKNIREVSSTVLSRIGLRALPSLINSINDQDSSESIKEILLSMGKSVFPFIEELSRQEDEIKAIFAVNLLREIDTVRCIEPLIGVLFNKNENIRRVALEVLIEIGEPALPGLVEVLYSQDMEAVSMARLAIEKSGLNAIPYLVSSTADHSNSDQTIIRDMIRDIGIPALPSLIFSLSKDRKGNETARELVQEYGFVAIPDLITIIKEAPVDLVNPIKNILSFLLEKDPFSFIDEIVSLKNISTDYFFDLLVINQDSIIPQLINILLGPDSNRSLTAGGLLAMFGKIAVRPLITALKEETDDDKKLVITSFLIKTGVDAISDLIDNLNDPAIVPYAVAALGAIGEPAVPALIKELKNHDEQVVEYTVITLTRIGKPATPYLISLMEQDKSMSPLVSHIMAEMKDISVKDMVNELSVLQKNGNADGERVSTLISTIVDTSINNIDDLSYLFTITNKGILKLLEDEFVKKGDLSIPSILNAVLNETIIPDLASRILTSNKALAIKAVNDMLDQMPPGDSGRVTLLHLSGLLKDPNSLSLMGKSLQDEDNNIRAAAAQELGNFGPDAKDSLIKAMKDKDPVVRVQAVESLGSIGLPVLDHLVDALKDPDPSIRSAALLGIAKIGEPGQFMLIQSLNDSDREVRKNVAILLENNHYVPKYTTDRISFLFALEDFDSLVKIGPPSLDILIRGLHDSDQEICTKSKKALSDIRNKVKGSGQ